MSEKKRSIGTVLMTIGGFIMVIEIVGMLIGTIVGPEVLYFLGGVLDGMGVVFFLSGFVIQEKSSIDRELI
jgi:hypothetical protein